MLRTLTVPQDTGRRLRHRPGVGTAASIVQASHLDVSHLSVDRPGILRVTSGRKHVRGPGISLVFETGSLALFGGGRAYDVLNEPAPHAPYRAEAVFFEWENLPHAVLPGTRAVAGVDIVAAPDHRLREAMNSAMAAISDSSLPDPVARHRVQEVLLWLGAHGLSILAPRRPSLEARIRGLVAADPAAGWSAARIARHVAMSEATLRRRLAASGTNLSGIILDVRLSAALALLQSTDEPVAAVAFLVGYESPSRFAARFRERFGFAPSAIREPAA
jgi:AraC-like DNA-binding protein